MAAGLESQFLFSASILEVVERNGFCVKIRETIKRKKPAKPRHSHFYETCFVSFWGLFYSYNYLLNIIHPLKCLTLISTKVFSFRLSISVHTIVKNYLDLTARRQYHRRTISLCSVIFQAVFLVSDKPLLFFFFPFITHKMSLQYLRT